MRLLIFVILFPLSAFSQEIPVSSKPTELKVKKEIHQNTPEQLYVERYKEEIKTGISGEIVGGNFIIAGTAIFLAKKPQNYTWLSQQCFTTGITTICITTFFLAFGYKHKAFYINYKKNIALTLTPLPNGLCLSF